MSAASPCNASRVHITRCINSTKGCDVIVHNSRMEVCLATGMASHLKQQEMNSLGASVRCPAYLQSRYGTCQMLVTAQSTRWSQCKRHGALRKCMQDNWNTATRHCHTCSTHSSATAAGFTSCCASEPANFFACINKVCLEMQAIDLCSITYACHRCRTM